MHGLATFSILLGLIWLKITICNADECPLMYVTTPMEETGLPNCAHATSPAEAIMTSVGDPDDKCLSVKGQPTQAKSGYCNLAWCSVNHFVLSPSIISIDTLYISESGTGCPNAAGSIQVKTQNPTSSEWDVPLKLDMCPAQESGFTDTMYILTPGFQTCPSKLEVQMYMVQVKCVELGGTAPEGSTEEQLISCTLILCKKVDIKNFDTCIVLQPDTTTTVLTETTTQPAITTTVLSETTTNPAIITTVQSETTTQPAITTTVQSETTTQPAITTTVQSETTTQPAITTTVQSETTTQPAITTTVQSKTTTQPATTTTVQSETTTQPATTSTVQSQVTTQTGTTTEGRKETTSQETSTIPTITTTNAVKTETTSGATMTSTQNTETTSTIAQVETTSQAATTITAQVKTVSNEATTNTKASEGTTSEATTTTIAQQQTSSQVTTTSTITNEGTTSQADTTATSTEAFTKSDSGLRENNINPLASTDSSEDDWLLLLYFIIATLVIVIILLILMIITIVIVCYLCKKRKHTYRPANRYHIEYDNPALDPDFSVVAEDNHNKDPSFGTSGYYKKLNH